MRDFLERFDPLGVSQSQASINDSRKKSMSTNDSKRHGYESMGSLHKMADASSSEQKSLKPSGKKKKNNDEKVDQSNLTAPKREIEDDNTQIQLEKLNNKPSDMNLLAFSEIESLTPDVKLESPKQIEEPTSEDTLTPSERVRFKKREKIKRRDEKLLSSDTWLLRKGHLITYIVLYLFSILVFFRPYELFKKDSMFPDSFLHLEYLEGTAIYFAVATLVIYFPVQYLTDGDFTIMSPEIKCILGIAAISCLSLVIAKDRVLAFEVLTDEFLKAVLIFLVLVNVMRTRWRLIAMFWLSMSVGLYLSYSVLLDFANGTFRFEGTRIAVEIGGLFGNPNDMALHLVTITPIAVALGLATKNTVLRLLYFSSAAVFIGGIIVTDSRGGALGIVGVVGVLAWKIGRRYRLRVTLISLAAAAAGIIVAPGKYGVRLLSIIIPGLDQSGSSSQRTDLLKRSILVTIRNPWGIGIGNFPVVGQRNLDTHNAFTQVSSEIGLLGLALYLIFLISPFRKLGAIERKLFNEERVGWLYYISIGLQASIVGYMVSSFFLSVAYNWYVYYLIAYAVGFRRIYQIEMDKETKPDSLVENLLGWKVQAV